MIDVIFSKEVIAYLNELSSVLMKNKEVRQYSDVATFAYFCRKSNLISLSERYNDNKLRLGRGTVFHIAPSNVPVNFAYSLVVGLLAGNTNIVRIPSKSFRQVELIVGAINQIAEIHPVLAQRVKLVQYERGGVETDTYSAIADVRVIWGGDDTIANIRKSVIPPRSFDITFADRYSIAIINANQVLKEVDTINKLVEDFYNDTYLFDQNACTAPHLIVWQGQSEEVKSAQEVFWNAFQKYEKERYQFQAIMAVDKLTTFYHQAIAGDVLKKQTCDNTLWRVDVKELNENIEQFRCSCGYFSEYSTDNLDEIAPIITTKYQTMAYYGIDKEFLEIFVLKNRIRGVDRIVPIGKTTDFDLVWDGYDLIEQLSRKITIK